MLKLLPVFLLMFLSFPSFASSNLNHISCMYFNDGNEWVPWRTQWAESFDLANGEVRALTGNWTSQKPTPPEFALCTAMVGTDSDTHVVVETFNYKARAFDPSGPTLDCGFGGEGVELVAKKSTLLKRGNFVDVDSEWLPPYQRQLKVRTYFPTIEEIGKVDTIVSQKCLSLTPDHVR